jgi:tetratricopeptide (TPR) repeat protein
MAFLEDILRGWLRHAALCAVFWVIVTGSADGGNSFDYRATEAKIASRDFAAARSELEGRLEAAPRDARAHLLLGIVFAETANLGAAEQHFRKAAQLNPADPAAYVNLGKLLAARGDRKVAAKEFEAALKRDAANTTAHVNLGLIQIAEKQFTQAESHLNKAVVLAPYDAGVLTALLQAQLGAKRFSASRSTVSKLLAIAASKADAFETIGAMQAQAGDYTEAIRNLEKARTLVPDSYEVQYNLGLAYQRSGDAKRSLEVLEPLAKSNPAAETANLLGSVYEENGRYLDAVRAFQRAAESEPANEDYRFDYIWELLEHRSFEPARLVAERAVGDFSSSMRIKLALGVAWFGLQRFNEAQNLFVESAKQFPGSDLPLYYVTLAPDTSELAIPETKPLLLAQHERYPQRFLPLYLLGHVALREKEPKAASELLEQSLRIQPNDAPARYELGRAYADLGRFREAILQYQAAVHLSPKLTEAWYRLYLAAHSSGDADLARQAEATFRKLQQATEQQDAIRSFIYSMR